MSIPRFLQKSLISGFLRSRVDASVNEVNALLIAKERGITIGEKNLYGLFRLLEFDQP
ncbi:hypothetical protein RCO48_26830 [Peribacillus frigoritolerans]|nr:hypothetical protein [Peribacillus frigoritolerans]